MLYSDLTLQLQPKIEEITKPFLEQNGFNYFQYLRCYNDGSYSMLANDIKILKLFANLSNKIPLIYSSFEEENQTKFSYWFLWEESLPKQPVELVKKEVGLHNGLTFVRRAKKHYDMIAVALPKHINNQGTFYLNKKHLIEEFIIGFDANQKSLIESINKNPIQLPIFNRDQNFDRIPLTNGGIELQVGNKKAQLSCQELKVLHLYIKGISYKQIAKILSISERTVETYLLRMKLKCNFNTISELHKLINFCQ
jgi:DNA-binding CsgD family transcriptional regulator